MKHISETNNKKPGWIANTRLGGHRVALSLALVITVFAFDQAAGQLPAPAQKTPIALVGGDIYLEGGEVIAGGTIVFDQGKIVALGQEPDLPEGCQMIDVSGKQVHPGLILSRTSLGLTEISRHAEST